jgi:hypothetical protein
MPEIKTKHCGKCGEVKPADCFTKDSNSKDGLHINCKDCKRQFENFYKKNRRIHLPEIDHQNSRSGIDSWQQVDSVLRTMAESQIEIDKERAVCDKRVELIKKYSEEAIEPYLAHKTGLEAMLANFLTMKLSGIKATVRKFLFGQIYWNKGKVTITLNTELANRRMGKP